MKTRVELEEAISLITTGLSPLGTERLPLGCVLGRTLAEDLTAPLDQPPFDRSPLDGYALRAADLSGATRTQPARLTVVDIRCAGDVASIPVAPGQAVRIMTGAMLPTGADCVIRQEDTDRGAPTVTVFETLNAFDNFCHQGEDYRAGMVLLPAGTPLDAAAVGVLASAGFWTDLPVRRRPSVGVICTGDEVVYPNIHPLPPGKIYGSNGPLLTARLSELGILSCRFAQAEDNPRTVADAIRRFLETFDVVITTGGVSEGDRDILHEALPLLHAERVFWRVNVKPGTPAMFSRYGGKPILSLSGNPFAAAATFELLCRPLLAALADEPRFLTRRTSATLSSGFGKASGGRRFLRGRYADGAVSLPREHASGLLSSLVGCNALVDIPAGSGPLSPGGHADILLL